MNTDKLEQIAAMFELFANYSLLKLISDPSSSEDANILEKASDNLYKSIFKVFPDITENQIYKILNHVFEK